MVRRSVLPMVERARLLPWHVEVTQPARGYGYDLNLLLSWCAQRYARELWFWPGPGAVWCFADHKAAESFAAHARELTGCVAGVRDSRATKTPPWAGKKA